MIEPLKKLYTVTEYYALVDEGVLREDDRVELIEGEIRHMPPIGSQHAAGTNRLNLLFHRGLGDRATVSVRGPVRLSEISEPAPDLLLLRFREDFYASRHPRPEDVLLLVEVADSSLGYDQGTKAPLYARHGIPEVWTEALGRTTLEVYRDPSPQGYRDVRTLRRGDRISPLAFPDLVLEVSAILG